MKFLDKYLQERSDQGLLRTLKPYGEEVDFCSNDYLGYARNSSISKMADQLIDQSIPVNGSAASRLIKGNFRFTEILEQEMAKVFEAEAALLFNSGYVANLGIISCIARTLR